MRFFVKIRFDVHNSHMATDRHQAPSYPLRMPEGLKARIQASANESGRSLHAELLHRLERSYEKPSGDAVDLAPTVVRLERDLAQAEMNRMYETLLARVLASTLKSVLANVPADEKIDGPLGNADAAQWLKICDGFLEQRKVTISESEAVFARLKKAEVELRALAPNLADPIWETMAALKQFDPGLAPPGKKRSSKPKP